MRDPRNAPSQLGIPVPDRALPVALTPQGSVDHDRKIEPERTEPSRLRSLAFKVLSFALASLLMESALWSAQEEGRQGSIRIAVFNVLELGAEKIDPPDSKLRGAHPQLIAAAKVISHTRPDLLVLNEIDYDAHRNLPQLFLQRYLEPLLQSSGEAALPYFHQVYLPVNTGIPSALDLDNDGTASSPGDSWGFGRYPGQYGMAVLSRFPIDGEALRTFRGLRWITMPGHLIPDGRDGRPSWYSAEEAAVLRLSSKSHWDVPVNIHGHVLHLLVSHPTPPVFDGDEDRNGRRNHDEIRFWADYLSTRADDPETYLVDDRGHRGGLGVNASFVIAGDLNADPYNRGPLGSPVIDLLLKHPRIHDAKPRSEGMLPEKPGRSYPGEKRERTSSYGRLDYLLPSRNLKVEDSGVFLPSEASPDRGLVEGEGRASDHQMVWLDLSMKGLP